MSNLRNNNRNPLFDYLKSISMLFVFLHHFYLTINPSNRDYIAYYNPFAEFFVGIAGFLVGYVYLNRNNDTYLFKRGLRVLFAYYLIAIPIDIIIALTVTKEDLFQTIINCIFFLKPGYNWVAILIFYGFTFMLLPLILPLYRKNKSLTLIFSILLFLISLNSTVREYFLGINSYYFMVLIMFLFQWQMFLMIGLRIGDLYKNNLFHPNKLKPFLFAIGLIGLLIQVFWMHPDTLQKMPYTFEKFLNLSYIAPLFLYTLINTYKYVKDSTFDLFIRVLGRYSLIAYVLSDVLRFGLNSIWLYFNKQVSELNSFLIAIVSSIILIFLIKIYASLKAMEMNKFNGAS